MPSACRRDIASALQSSMAPGGRRAKAACQIVQVAGMLAIDRDIGDKADPVMALVQSGPLCRYPFPVAESAYCTTKTRRCASSGVPSSPIMKSSSLLPLRRSQESLMAESAAQVAGLRGIGADLADLQAQAAGADDLVAQLHAARAGQSGSLAGADRSWCRAGLP